MARGNIFHSIPQTVDKELFTTLIQDGNVKIERIVSRGHASPEDGWYDQNQHEWVIVLQGEAIIVFDTGQQLHLTAGEYLNIPAHTKHRVSWTPHETDTLWLAVHYGTATP